MVEPVTIGEASAGDRDAVEPLLRASGLNAASIFQGDNLIIVARDAEDRVVGVAGIAWHDTDALLRSVAVADSARGAGIGGKLVKSALAAMRDRGSRSAYLLTNDADEYFARFGFVRVERDAVSGPVTENPQFVEECPATARVMELVLRNK